MIELFIVNIDDNVNRRNGLLLFIGLMIFVFSSFWPTLRLYLLGVSAIIVFIGVFLLVKNSRKRFSGLVRISENGLIVDGSQLLKAIDISEVLFYYGGYTGYTQFRWGESGSRNYLFVRHNNGGGPVLFQVHLNDEYEWRRINELSKLLPYSFIVREIQTKTGFMSLADIE
jgi:hypothetical protein